MVLTKPRIDSILAFFKTNVKDFYDKIVIIRL